MASVFSSSDAAAIERQLEADSDFSLHEQIQLEDFWNLEQSERCVNWIKQHDFKKVCLQFPDVLLPFSTTVTEQLQMEAPSAEIFILGDTSYGSCCVDEIAASHVSADAIIHFGHACLSRSVRLPTEYVFLRRQLEVEQLVAAFQQEFADPQVKLGVFYDVSFYHYVSDIECRLKQIYANLSIGQLAEFGSQPDLLCWKLKDSSFEDSVCVFIGQDNQSFFNTSNSIKAGNWFRFDPASSVLNLANPLDSKWLRRRFYYIEKCKDAASLGIVVATLSATGYLDIVNHIQQLAKARGVRTYIISVGKINTAKLANFTEIDCFVLVGCPENDLFTSRDFYKPLVSVFECELALNPAWSGQFPSGYSTNFSDLLPAGRLHKPFDASSTEPATADVSLVSGKVRHVVRNETQEMNGNNCQEIQLRGKNEVAQISAADEFYNRTWQGLEQHLGRDAPVAIEEGRSGIPIKYDNDPSER